MAKKNGNGDSVDALQARIADLEAQIAATQPTPPPDPNAIDPNEPIRIATGADVGDPVVFIRDFAGLHRCYAKDEKRRQITVHGVLHEHTSEHDGVWVYEAR